MRRVLYTATIVLLIAACSPQPAKVWSKGWVEQASLSSEGDYENLGPSVPIFLDEPSTVTVQFLGQFQPSYEQVTRGVIGDANGGGGVTASLESVPITLRVLIGSQVGTPDDMTTGGGGYGPESHGIIAVAENVPAGLAAVQLQWKSKSAGATASKGAIVVWTTPAKKP